VQAVAQVRWVTANRRDARARGRTPSSVEIRWRRVIAADGPGLCATAAPAWHRPLRHDAKDPRTPRRAFCAPRVLRVAGDQLIARGVAAGAGPAFDPVTS
jgi:hypothetical protein